MALVFWHGGNILARSMMALGFMSGTSMDGIDAALIKTNGETIEHFGPTCSSVFKPAQRRLLMAAVEVARTMKNRQARPAVLAEAEHFITTAHSDLAAEFMSR